MIHIQKSSIIPDHIMTQIKANNLIHATSMDLKQNVLKYNIADRMSFGLDVCY